MNILQKAAEILQKAAEILVESGYAKTWCRHAPDYNRYYLVFDSFKDEEMAEPFSDTLEGRRQADVIENHLIWNGFHREFMTPHSSTRDFHQWRLDQMENCLQQLINKEKQSCF